MSFAVSDSQSASLIRQRLDAIYGSLLKDVRDKVTGPKGIAYRVGLLRASDREKYQIAAGKWGPQFESVVAGLQKWMDARNKLYKMPETDWGTQGEELAAAGDKLIGSINALHNRVINADWGNVLKYTEFAVWAAAQIPEIVFKGTEFVLTKTGETISKGGAAVTKGLADTLRPIKWWLIGAAVIAGLYFSYPLIRAMSARRSSRAS